MLLNSYFICLVGSARPVPFDPFTYEASHFSGFIEIDYLAKALQELERQEVIKGLTFYITWDTVTLPSYGQNIVAILMGDEWCRFPHYLGQVSAIFRSHSNWPMYTGKVKNGLTYGNIIALIQFVRMHILGLPGRWHYLRSMLKKSRIPTRTFVIPLGYANQANLPVKPLTQRNTDLSFMGSMNNVLSKKTSLKYWLNSPKTASREQMVENIKALQKRHPELSTYVHGSGEFTGNMLRSEPQIEDEKARYSNRLMDSKIVLVPRGSSLETFRLFEAMRYGSIAICENLPQRWYYQNLPALPIDRWNHLESLVLELLSDPERLKALHQEALEYWQNVCSEAILGKYMSVQLAQEKAAHMSLDRSDSLIPAENPRQ